jgi:predicted DsbA family dithiol-disulfide isomerase
VTGVPFFVFDGKLAVSGGQPESVFVQALQRAWGDRPAPGEACGPEGCEV